MRYGSAAALIVSVLLSGCPRDTSLTGAADASEEITADTQEETSGGVVIPGHPPPYEPECGNGILDEDEVCDDGNTESLDGCDADCTYTCVEDADCSLGTVCSTDVCNLERHACEHHPIRCADDEPCTYDYCDDAAGCRHRWTGPWYRDADRDCWGSLTDTTCGTATMPRGYTATGGDCCDSEPSVSPHETEYHWDPYDCDGAVAPTFDFNCNGEEEPRWLQVGRCDTGSGTLCLIEEGWVGDPPACGEDGRWLTECRRDAETGVCQPAWDIARSQRCR
ncbi:MAG: hypothetical protein JRG91_16865 [Deltaproteobacteria bacterium]|nr:hypothetical protein [Deltaproteobacteria bacterium]